MTLDTEYRFTLEELVALPNFYLPRPSWDGARIAYYSDESGRMELWVLEISSGTTRQVSRGQTPTSLHAGFAWNRAGTGIVFAKDEGGNEEHDIWVLHLDSGEAERLTNSPGASEVPIEFGPDDAWLSFVSTRHGQLNLFKLRADGSEVVQLTDFANPVWGAAGIWSPDGALLTATANETADPRNEDVYVVAGDGSGARRVFSSREGAKDSPIGWMADGSGLAIQSDASGSDRAGIVDLTSDTVRWLGDSDAEEVVREVSSDGRSLLVLRNHDAVLRPVLYDLVSGEARVLQIPEGGTVVQQDASFALGGRAMVARCSADATRARLQLFDLDTGAARTLLALSDGSIAPNAFVRSQDIRYSSFDGLAIHGLLYKPHGASAEHPAPALVMPHGGPTGQYFHNFDLFTQFLVNEGYVVLAPNVRGSTGYGVEFRDMARHDWGGADLEDLVAGRSYLARLPYVNLGRMGIFGGSYGGYMTYMAVTKRPELWKAGAAWVGMTDLESLHDEGLAYLQYYLCEQMGDRAGSVELWRDRSALYFAHQLQAKLLIVHGVNDPRCPISQARVFRDRLLAAGKHEGQDFEYVELSDEGHGSTDQGQRLRAFRLLADFLRRSL